MWIGPGIVAASAVLFPHLPSHADARPTNRRNSSGSYRRTLAAVGCRGGLVKIEIDPETGRVATSAATHSAGLPCGFVCVAGARSVVATQHPELGIDLAAANDLLLFLALEWCRILPGLLVFGARRAAACMPEQGRERPPPGRERKTCRRWFQ